MSGVAMVKPNTGPTPEFRHMKGTDVEKGVLLGKGGFGAVYKANHREYGEVALKVVNTDAVIEEEDKADLIQEAHSLARVPNQYVTLLYGVILEPGNYSLVMEYVEHGALDKFMRKVTVPWALKVRMIQDITCGMNFLHGFKPQIIHRDLKMPNILVGASLHVKISDLGLAKWRTFSKKYMKKRSKERGGYIAGTITHIPPENLLDINRKATETFDVYSFGILLWEIITGKEPYEGCRGNEALITVGVCTNQNRPSDDEIPVDCPEWLLDLMKRCYHQEPEQRPLFPESYTIVHTKLREEYTDAMMKDAEHAVHNALRASDKNEGTQQDRKMPIIIAQPSSPDEAGEASRQLGNLQLDRTTPEAIETDAVLDQPPQAAAGPNKPPCVPGSTKAGATTMSSTQPTEATFPQGATGTTGATATMEHQGQTGKQSALRARGKTTDDKAKFPQSAEAPSKPPANLVYATSKTSTPSQDSMPPSPHHADEKVKKGKIVGPPSEEGSNESYPTRNRVENPVTTPYQETSQPGLAPGVFPGMGMQPPHYPYTMPVAGGFMIYSAPGMAPYFYPAAMQAAHMSPMNFPAAMPGATPHGGLSCVKTGSDGSTMVINVQGQMEGVQIGDKNVMYVNSGGRGQVRGTRRVPQRRVVAGKPITTDQRVITKEDITVISENLGSAWRKLGRQLGFTEGKIDAFDSDYAIDGLEEKIYQMLIAWRRMKADDATAAKLAEALCSIGKADVAVYL